MESAPNMMSINRRTRLLLASEDARSPGSQAHRERTAVYAVAVGDRLGMDEIALVRLRLAAELRGIDALDPELSDLVASNELSLAIVELCVEYDRLRSGFGGGQQTSDEDCITWMKTTAPSKFEGAVVDALLTVQAVIQPIGT